MEQPTKTDIWMPLYWGDLLADTLHLNRADFGSYILLIGAYWRNGGPIADDDEALCTATRCLRQDWSRTKGILSAFFTVSNGKWTHKRIEIELAAARKRKQDIIDNSRKGVEARRALGQLPKEPKVHPKVEPKDEPEGNQRRTYSPSPSPSSVQAQSHTHTPESVCDEKVKIQKDNHAIEVRIKWLRSEIGKMFKREVNYRMSYEEETTILEVAKRSSSKEEFETIQKWRHQIPKNKLRYFPQSMSSLLRDWDKTLDRARAEIDLRDGKEHQSVADNQFDRLIAQQTAQL